MIKKISIELTSRQIEEAVERLPARAKMRLLNKLGQENLKESWENFLKSIDKKLKKFPVSQQEISEEIAAYRREKNAKTRR